LKIKRNVSSPIGDDTAEILLRRLYFFSLEMKKGQTSPKSDSLTRNKCIPNPDQYRDYSHFTTIPPTTE
jgi:hypothetical protein